MRIATLAGAGLLVTGCTALNQRFDQGDATTATESGEAQTDTSGSTSLDSGTTGPTKDVADPGSTGSEDRPPVCYPELVGALEQCMAKVEWSQSLQALEPGALGRAPFRQDLVEPCFFTAGPVIDEYMDLVCVADDPWCTDREKFREGPMETCATTLNAFPAGASYRDDTAELAAARTALLGSMPGCASLHVNEAHAIEFEPGASPTIAGDAIAFVLARATLPFPAPEIARYQTAGAFAEAYDGGFEAVTTLFPSTIDEWEFATAFAEPTMPGGCYNGATILLAMHRGRHVFVAVELAPG